MGGLNDMLSEIDRCYNHCLKYKRTLVIDTSRNWFKEDIHKYINLILLLFIKDQIMNYMSY
jgi:hypothetical protein